jgi:glycosyltransferase involved in cell wall biosynthesis
MSEVRIAVRRLNSWSGIPYARNRGAEVASHPIYLITDGNTVYPKDWDGPVHRHFHRSRILAGTISDMDSAFRGYGCALVLPSMGATWLPTPDAYGGYVPLAACTCTVIDQSLFHQLGGYDETLPLYGAAEPEFSVRAWLSGYEIVNVPDLVVQHRFRPKAEHDAFRASISPTLLRGYLRFACYYLPEKLLFNSYEYFQKMLPRDFDECMGGLVAEGVWERREHLTRKLPRTFDWFVSRFRLQSVSTSNATRFSSTSNLSIVVLTHDAYLRWLPDVMAGIHRQKSAIRELILVVNSDSAKLPDLRRFGSLKVIQQKFASPNDARNAGLAHVKTDWVCYVDGDNIPVEGYFARISKFATDAPGDVAILYPDIKRVREDGWVKEIHMPDWDFWKCREQSIIDTCSAWRASALREAGGWFTPASCLQDYTTALKLTQRGWKARKARGLTATLRDHAASVSSKGHGKSETLWHARRFAVVTLFAGRRRCLAPLMDWYMKETFPPDSHLIWVDDSDDAAFHSALCDYVKILRPRVASIVVWKNPCKRKDTSTLIGRHGHVADMYTRVIRSVLADVYLTIEDDVIARKGAVKQILECGIHIPYSKWGGICAVYPTRSSKDRVYMCASVPKDRWIRCPISGFPPKVVEMGYIGAGFAAWSGAALHKALPLQSAVALQGEWSGWDAALCCKLAKLGYKVGVDGRIHCQHLCV